MFGLRNKQEEEVAVEEEPEVKLAEVVQLPVGRIPEKLIDQEKQRSYEEIAESLDFYPIELAASQLHEFFRNSAIKLYDYEDVNAWMVQKRKEAGADFWCWRPLREKDVITVQWGYDAENEKWSDGFYTSSKEECRPYDRLVPKHALERALLVEEKFGDQIAFFITDYPDPNADPFIMVRLREVSNIPLESKLIFDVWDEPGFGE